MSYADFITLLFAFFVVLFATGQSDRNKKTQLALSIQSAFSQMSVFDIRRNSAAAKPSLSITASAGELLETRMKRSLQQVAKQEMDSGLIAVRNLHGETVISLQESAFFASGSADLLPSALQLLNRVSEILPEKALRIEGHTDTASTHSARFASNWELSSMRACSVARVLLTHPNVKPDRLSVSGFAEFHPVASNETAAGKALNRRVDIVLLSSGEGSR